MKKNITLLTLTLILGTIFTTIIISRDSSINQFLFWLNVKEQQLLIEVQRDN